MSCAFAATGCDDVCAPDGGEPELPREGSGLLRRAVRRLRPPPHVPAARTDGCPPHPARAADPDRARVAGGHALDRDPQPLLRPTGRGLPGELRLERERARGPSTGARPDARARRAAADGRRHARRRPGERAVDRRRPARQGARLRLRRPTRRRATQATPIKEIPIKEIPIKEIPITEIPITEIPITEIGFSRAHVCSRSSASSRSPSYRYCGPAAGPLHSRSRARRTRRRRSRTSRSATRWRFRRSRTSLHRSRSRISTSRAAASARCPRSRSRSGTRRSAACRCRATRTGAHSRTFPRAPPRAR